MGILCMGRYRWRRSDNRQFEGKHRAVAELARNPDRPVVRFDDGLGDGQSHAGALHAITLVPSAIKFVEDQ